jgi:ribose transport system substrate-binding protein
MVVPTLNNPFFVTVADSATKTAAAAGYTVTVLDAGNDPGKQLTQAQDLISKGPACLLFDPVDSDAIAPAVLAANAAGIPVSAIDRKPSKGTLVGYAASDSLKVGEAVGTYVVNYLKGKGNVVILEGIVGSASAHDRTIGFRNIIQGTGVKELALQSAAYDRAKAVDVTQNLLTAYANIDLIYAENDEMALGAITALAAAGRTIPVVGIDAIPDAIAAIKAGTQLATVSIHPDLYGQYGMQACLDALAGKTPGPDRVIPAEVVTKDNVSQF